MSHARPCLGLLFLLLVVFAAAPRAEGACNATCKRDLERCMATQCEGVPRSVCRRRCKPVAIRMLAYVQNECRVDAGGVIVRHQQLRIRRGDREPITVAEYGPSIPAPDELGLCRLYGESRSGPAGVVAGQLQRLGVSPDGSVVVFEVDSERPGLFPKIRLPADQQGLFLVRADGSGRRRLGPASRESTFRTSPDPSGTFPLLVSYSPLIAFSPNGRRIAFTDRGPGSMGEDAVQIMVLDLATGERTQVTRLPSGTPPSPDLFLTAYPRFIDNETVEFFTYVDPDGSNPEHQFTAFSVRIDGRSLKSVPIPTGVATSSARILSTFGVAQLPTQLLALSVPGTPVNGGPGSSTIGELFVQDGKHLLQLTNFHRVDTTPLFLNGTRTRAFFKASTEGNCQLFSIGTLGSALRLLTHFNPGSHAVNDPACWNTAPPNCAVAVQGLASQDPVTSAIVFDSTCDPLHANASGEQIFAMRPDGHGLRQLTDAAGFTENPDGGIRVELPGPFAYSGLASY